MNFSWGGNNRLRCAEIFTFLFVTAHVLGVSPSYLLSLIIITCKMLSSSRDLVYLSIRSRFTVSVFHRSGRACVLSGPVGRPALSAPVIFISWALIFRSCFTSFVSGLLSDHCLFFDFSCTCFILFPPSLEFFESFNRSYIYSCIISVFVSMVMYLIQLFYLVHIPSLIFRSLRETSKLLVLQGRHYRIGSFSF